MRWSAGRVPRLLPPVPDALTALAARQGGLLSVRQCGRHGVTRQQVAARVRRKDWAPAARGVYDTGVTNPGGDPYDHRRRRAAVLGLLVHPAAVATGPCALYLRGVAGTPPEIRPEVTLPDGSSRESRGPVVVRRLPLGRWDLVDGFACATTVDALRQAVPHLDRRHALAVLDSALHQGLVTPAALAAAHDAARGHRGVARTHPLWALADGRSESPAESWARLSCHDLGVPPDGLQLPVVLAGRVTARVDLAWLLPDGGALLVEIDGAEIHSTPGAVVDDRRRQNLIDSRRTILRRFSGADAWRGVVGPQIARELRAAGWRPRPVRPDVVLTLDR